MSSEEEKVKIKVPTTFQEQVALFKKRNLDIEDPNLAENTLKRINYYRLSAYALTLKDPISKDQYIEGSSFNKMLSNVPYFYLESWLQTLSNVRNICAHYGRLYNKKLIFKPRLFKEEQKLFDNWHLFSAVYIIQRLLTKKEGGRFHTDLEALISEYEDSIDFSHIGFPTNWSQLLNQLNNQKDEKDL